MPRVTPTAVINDLGSSFKDLSFTLVNKSAKIITSPALDDSAIVTNGYPILLIAKTEHVYPKAYINPHIAALLFDILTFLILFAFI